MAFKNLALDRSLIDQAIATYDEALDVKKISSSETESRYEAFFNGLPKAVLIFYFTQSGKTTIHASGGKNPQLGALIAGHVRDNCQIAVPLRDVFTINPLQKVSFDLLLEYLVEECGARISQPVAIAGGARYEIIGRQGDRAVVSYYDNGTFMIQGTPLLLSHQIIDFLGEILDLHELIAAQLTLVATGITSSDILNELKACLPSSHVTLGNTLKAIISPVFALRRLEMELPDYSVMVFPVLKGLEGYMKQLLDGKGVRVRREGFAPFLREEGRSTLNDETIMQIGCEKTCTAFNQCYSYYKNNRHGLFHVDGIIRNTRLIEERAEACAIVTEVLELIESTYVDVNT